MFSPVTGKSPMFVTVTATARRRAGTPTSACGLCSPAAQASSWHPTLMRSAQRWWTRARIGRADPALFDPHLNRMLAKFDQLRTTGDGA